MKEIQMNNTFKLIAVTSLLALGAMKPASADSMRCGTHIISWGQDDSPGQYEVLKRCGKPTYRQGDTWVYEKSSSVSTRIRFDNRGNIIQIN
jgi:hypothetical protein